MSVLYLWSIVIGRGWGWWVAGELGWNRKLRRFRVDLSRSEVVGATRFGAAPHASWDGTGRVLTELVPWEGVAAWEAEREAEVARLAAVWASADDKVGASNRGW